MRPHTPSRPHNHPDAAYDIQKYCVFVLQKVNSLTFGNYAKQIA